MLESEGYKKLLKAVEKDEKESPNFHDYRGKFQWVLDRAEHYAEKTGLDANAILDAWEKSRDYWYMNYYQDSNQPKITDGKVRVFDTVEDLIASIGEKKFVCPRCKGITTSPYVCNSGKEMEKGKVCDWKVGGLFGDLGKGISIFVKTDMRIERIFMPESWMQE